MVADQVDYRANLVIAPDGTWEVYTARERNGSFKLERTRSVDEGKPWRGFREVYLDPVRNDTPPKRGDRGTAYPHAVEIHNGSIALVTGQGQGRRGLIIVDPGWLSETHCEENFSGGLDGWSVFKSFGPAQGWF